MKSGKKLSAQQLVAGAIGAVVVIGGLVMYNAKPRSEIRGKIESMAQTLRLADQRGDAGAAIQLLDGSTAILRQLNDQGDSRDAQACIVPAMHLSQGVAAVARGERWSSEDRYAASLSGCT